MPNYPLKVNRLSIDVYFMDFSFDFPIPNKQNGLFVRIHFAIFTLYMLMMNSKTLLNPKKE